MEISRKTSIILIVTSGFILCYKLYEILLFFFPIITTYEAASVGIIGGADGPTAIYLTSKLLLIPLLFSLLCFLAEIFICIFVLVKSIKAVRKKV